MPRLIWLLQPRSTFDAHLLQQKRSHHATHNSCTTGNWSHIVSHSFRGSRGARCAGTSSSGACGRCAGRGGRGRAGSGHVRGHKVAAGLAGAGAGVLGTALGEGGLADVVGERVLVLGDVGGARTVGACAGVLEG